MVKGVVDGRFFVKAGLRLSAPNQTRSEQPAPHQTVRGLDLDAHLFPQAKVAQDAGESVRKIAAIEKLIRNQLDSYCMNHGILFRLIAYNGLAMPGRYHRHALLYTFTNSQPTWPTQRGR